LPYTGIFPIELTLDHTGPMTRERGRHALLLEVLPGPTGSTRASGTWKTAAYTNALTPTRGLKIAVVKEASGHPNSGRT